MKIFKKNCSFFEVLVKWIYNWWEKGLQVSRKCIMRKVLFIYNEKVKENDCEDSVTLVPSTGWSKKFMCKNGLFLRWKTSVAWKDTSRLIDNLVPYILHVRRFAAMYNYWPANMITMDEMPIWSDLVFDTTVDKTGACTITVKSTGHEKCLVSVFLTAKADRLKLKPFIVFKNAKREKKTLNNEFKTWCVIVASSNSWMNNDLIIEVLGTSFFGRKFLALHSYKCHMDSNIAASFIFSNID